MGNNKNKINSSPCVVCLLNAPMLSFYLSVLSLPFLFPQHHHKVVVVATGLLISPSLQVSFSFCIFFVNGVSRLTGLGVALPNRTAKLPLLDVSLCIFVHWGLAQCRNPLTSISPPPFMLECSSYVRFNFDSKPPRWQNDENAHRVL